MCRRSAVSAHASKHRIHNRRAKENSNPYDQNQKPGHPSGPRTKAKEIQSVLLYNFVDSFGNHNRDECKYNQSGSNYIELAMRTVNRERSKEDILHQNQVRLFISWPGTLTFIPHMPQMMFIGSTIVPRTVSLPKTSAVCSWRSFMRMLICAR